MVDPWMVPTLNAGAESGAIGLHDAGAFNRIRAGTDEACMLKNDVYARSSECKRRGRMQSHEGRALPGSARRRWSQLPIILRCI